MSGPPEQPSEEERWLREAAEELHAARTLLDDQASPPRLACFLAHLAAEKAIKALLAHGGQPVPRIHDLGELALTLPASVRDGFDRRELETLTPWAIVGRYVGDLADVDPDTARSLVVAAERVLEVARATIGTVR